MISAWGLILLPGISTFIIWQYLGGVLYFPAILCLLLGHTLYALLIICMAMFATAVSKSLPTAKPFFIASNAFEATPTATDMVTGSIIGLH